MSFDPVSYALAKRAMHSATNITVDALKPVLWPSLLNGELGWGELITNFNVQNLLAGASGTGSASFSAYLELKTGGTANSFAYAARQMVTVPISLDGAVVKVLTDFSASTPDNPYNAYFGVGPLVGYHISGSVGAYVGILDVGSSTSHDLYLVWLDLSTSTEQTELIKSGITYDRLLVEANVNMDTGGVSFKLTDTEGNVYTASHSYGSKHNELALAPLNYYLEDGTNASNAVLASCFASWSIIPGGG